MKGSTEALIRDELAKARAAFPGNAQRLHAFAEEAGEVTKSFLDLQYGKCSPDDVRKELVQAAAMAIRLLEEGDAEFLAFDPRTFPCTHQWGRWLSNLPYPSKRTCDWCRKTEYAP